MIIVAIFVVGRHYWNIYYYKQVYVELKLKEEIMANIDATGFWFEIIDKNTNSVRAKQWGFQIPNNDFSKNNILVSSYPIEKLYYTRAEKNSGGYIIGKATALEKSNPKKIYVYSIDKKINIIFDEFRSSN
ncbi:hypothetical protein [Gorillibacterium massiliense]|uniref:hypothetical protein n=1 Tax=Gorillibacterium massiliense TaxID=1280390 RepID=UPI0012DEB2E3|nr:hypothetical protein [Gorillibacterium massiliense]